ncbi:MAG: type I-E CRISPR-associated protein Cse1/CasA [Armatimonadota bacterium]
MNRPSFNVLTMEWIPVIRKDGSHAELGILPCLETAHELSEIRDQAPIIEFGLYRLLIAFVLDALILADRRPEHPLDLKALIDEGSFDMHMMNNYVKECGEVFDLFHPERPFMQIACSSDDVSGPVEALFAHIPCGSEAIHWHHTKQNHLSVSPEQAARALTAVSPFMKQGGRGYSPSINGSSPLYAMPTIRDSLFKTLVLNLPLRSYGDSVASAAWLQAEIPTGRRIPKSITDGLTWQPRQLTIACPSNTCSAVAWLIFQPGFQIDGESWIDPNLAYRWGDKGVEKVSMRSNRPLWRDAGALALLPIGELGKGQGKVSLRRPDVIENAFTMLDNHETLCLNAYGLQAKQANIYEWTSSKLTIPAGIGKATRLGMVVESELQLAESIAKTLRSVILSLSPEYAREERKPPHKRKQWDKRSIRNLADRCERAYWQRLESSFNPLMTAVAALDSNAPDDPDIIAATARNWRDDICRLAKEQFEIAAKDMDVDSDALERQVRARGRLYHKLKEALS